MAKGVKLDEDGSERTCIVTGTKGTPETMLRFALAADGTVVPDIRRKLPGRGAWTRLSATAVSRAAAKGAFSRAFRAEAKAPDRLASEIETLLERDALQSLSMANKADLAVAGAFKVDAAIEKGGVAALITASDAAPDGAAKRSQALRAKLGARVGTITRINVFSSSQLGLALGKANVIHAALKSGAASSAFLARAERLRLYRASETDAVIDADGEVDRANCAKTLGRPEELAERPSD